MKSLTEFIKESLINEGGHAVSGTPMTQVQAREVYNDVAEFLKTLGLTEEGVDFCALGSFGKKFDDQTSGDIDIAISVDKIASENHLALDEVEQYICDVLDRFNINYVCNTGIHVISLSWPFPSDKSLFGQVDLMPTTSMDFSKWMYYSPDFRSAESKYKGLYRNQLIMAILKFADRKVLSKTEQGDIIEYERYALRLNSGLARTRRSFMGKKGGLIKTEKALKEFERHVTNVPDEIVKIAFGENTMASQVMTFEAAYEKFMSNDFPWASERKKIIDSFVHELTSNKFPIPMEVSKDWNV